MGMFADVLAAHRTFVVPSRLSLLLQKWSTQLQDPALPTEFAAKDEVQTFAEVADATDGTYTITVYVRFKTTGVVISFTTAALAHDANAAARGRDQRHGGQQLVERRARVHPRNGARSGSRRRRSGKLLCHRVNSRGR